MRDIPVFDFSKFDLENPESFTQGVNAFGSALSNIGFVYVVNHGIPKQKITEAFEAAKEFFAQSQHEKLKYLKHDTAKDLHGFTPRGQERLGPKDNPDIMRETFDFWDWNAKELNGHPVPARLFQSCLALKDECKTLTCVLLRLIASTLKLDPEEFINAHSGLITQRELVNSSYSRNKFRALYYPGISELVETPQDFLRYEKAFRFPEHTDIGTITLLFQGSKGLELQTVDNQWIPAEPMEDAILINTGDLLEIWSGGLYPATPHRVILPSEDSERNMSRQSLTYFVNPDDSIIVGPPAWFNGSATGRENKQDYTPTTCGDYYRSIIKLPMGLRMNHKKCGKYFTHDP